VVKKYAKERIWNRWAKPTIAAAGITDPASVSPTVVTHIMGSQITSERLSMSIYAPDHAKRSKSIAVAEAATAPR